MMNRSDWLKQKRRLAETRMDTLFAPIYDEHWGAVEPAHQRFIDKFPVVYGEMGHEDGYHYYPKLDQVKTWLQNARFRLIEEEMALFEDEEPEVGEAGYHHFLVQKS